MKGIALFGLKAWRSADELELRITHHELKESLRASCDVLRPAIPFIRRPVEQSKTFAVRFGRNRFSIWKWHAENSWFFVRGLRCRVHETESGVRLQLAPTRRSLFGTLWILSFRLMTGAFLVFGALDLVQDGWSKDVGFLLGIGGLMLWINIIISVMRSTARDIEETEHAEIKELLVGLSNDCRPE